MPTEQQDFTRAAIEAFDQGELVSAAFVEQNGVRALVEMSEYRVLCEENRSLRRKGMFKAFALSFIISSAFAAAIVLEARAEEPTKTDDAFYQLGKGIGWLGHRIGDAGKGIYRSATEDSDECAETYADMTKECLQEFEDFVMQAKREIEQEWARRSGE